MTKAIEVKDLSMQYGKLKALDEVSFKVEKGEMLAILGPSGCGKSTLLTLISGLKEATKGEIYLGERRIDHLPPQKREIGFLFQNYALFPHLTVRENIGFGLKIRKYSKDDLEKRVDELIALVGLEEHANKKPRQLSGGQQQRVALARAVAPNPEILLLDEPLSALDVKIRHRLRGELKKLQREIGITTILVTHDQEEAFELGDRVAVMNEGSIEQLATPEELYEYPTSEFVASFVGSINRLPGNLLVRPENFILTKLTSEKGKEGNVGNIGLINSMTYLGANFKIEVILEEGQELYLNIPKNLIISEGIQVGDKVLVEVTKSQSFDPETKKLILEKKKEREITVPLAKVLEA